MHLRPFAPADAAPLTALLHRAYAELGARGLNFTAVDQDDATTLRRATGGASWVLERDGVLAATITVSLPPEAALRTLTAEAAVPRRAWLNQLAVDPAHRGRGLARRLRDVGYAWCREQGCTSIGLDTAEPAEHLVRLYGAWGFVPVDQVRWPGKRYRSVVLARDVPPEP
ncbi:MAG TPA: GNAT family N-acetyltransferase [Cellulomonas sp.]